MYKQCLFTSNDSTIYYTTFAVSTISDNYEERLDEALQILKFPAYDPSDAFSSPAKAR
jgi:hypothetical protein